MRTIKTHPGTKAVLLASAAALCMPAGGSAQETAVDEEARLPTVTTTAQRREENLQDVPIAVSAFSAEALQKKQINEPIDLIEHVPNLYGGNNTGLGSANMYYIRGLGNTETIATFDPPVGTYVDEVYIARQNANNTAFFDVEQIEVLRGPQGTLFGRNTTGGAVSIRMRKPSDTFGGYVEGEIGNYERYGLRGSLDLPVADTVLTKLSAFWLEEDGYVDAVATGETLNGQEAWGLRGDVRFLLSDTVTWDISADVTEDESANVLNYDENASPLGALVPGGKTDDGQNRISNTGLSTQDGSGTLLEQALAGQGLGVENSSFSLTSNLEWELTSESAVNFIVGWRSLEQDFILDFFDGGLGGEQYSTGGFTIANEGEHDQFSAELKYAATYFDGALDLVTGLYYFEEDNTTDFADLFTINVSPDPAVVIPFPLLLADRVLDNDLTSKAVYAQADWHPAERWTVTLGARWTEETKEIDFRDNRDPATTPDPSLRLDSANLTAAGVPLEQTKALVTPRFAVEYEANDDVSFFVSYTQGFKSGGWNARGTVPVLLQPFFREVANSYEAGMRSTFLDDRIRFNATAFFQDTEDLQSPSAFVAPDGSISFITRNFSDFENTGLEIDASWVVTSDFTIDASLGLQDAEYTNPDASIVQQIADCQADGGASGGLGIVAPDCSLAEPVRVPDTTFSLGAFYDFDIPSLGATLTPAANVRYVSETFTGTSNLPNSIEDGYTLLNVGATLAFEDLGWRVSLECKNCTDEAYVTSNLPPTTYYSEPRRVTFRIRKDF